MSRGSTLEADAEVAPGVFAWGAALSVTISRTVAAMPFALLFVVVYAAFVRSEAGQQTDAAAFNAITPHYVEFGELSMTVRVLLPMAAAVSAGAAILVTLIVGRWRPALAAGIAMLMAVTLPAVLKEGLARPFHGEFVYTQNTFPSGHTTMVATAAACCICLSPRRWRPLVAIVALPLVVVAGAAQLTSYAHRFSDVIGGILMSGAILAACIARPEARRSASTWAAYTLLTLTVLGSIVLVVRWSYEDYSTAFNDAAVNLMLVLITAAAASVVMISFASASSPVVTRPRRRRRGSVAVSQLR